MLQKLGDHIAECRRRAAECDALAADGSDERSRLNIVRWQSIGRG
jgi:hypothetical protein